MQQFLGIDAGTTALKAALFDLDGHVLGLDHQEYQLLMPAASVVELDAEDYWAACCRAIRNVLKQSGVAVEEVAGICIASQGETLIPVDEAGSALRRAIVWLDKRASLEAQLIGARFPIEELYHTTGQPDVTPTWTACKILWLSRHEPEVFARTAKFLLLEDFLLYRLTGQYVTEYSLQTSSLLLDIHQKRWWTPMLDFVGITPERLPRLLEPGDVVGPLTSHAAAVLGLTTGTLVVSGALDQMVAAVGAGNIAPGVVTETTGGALAIVATLERPRFDPRLRVPCHYHARPDTYCLLPWGQTAGMALKWFRDTFFHLEGEVARQSGIDPYDHMMRIASEAPAGAAGLVVLPHLEGAACPEFNPAAVGVFFGATLHHTRGHFVRAILESVAYMLKKNLEIVEQLGVAVTSIRSTGGGSRSDLWLRIKADVLQKPLITTEIEEVTCLGAALLAAVATGDLADLETGVSRMVRLRQTIEPSTEHEAAYRSGYARYVELYDRLAPMFNDEQRIQRL